MVLAVAKATVAVTVAVAEAVVGKEEGQSTDYTL